MIRNLLLIVSLVLTTAMLAQPANEAIRAGNEQYKAQRFDMAATQYNRALKAEPGNNTARLNLATTLYKLGNNEEATQLFTRTAQDAADPVLKGQAFYDKGVILGKQKKLEESIEAYKNALRQNPADKEARENLQKALQELKKKNPPPPKKENKKKQEQQKQKQQQPQSRLSPKEAEQQLKLLEQKEKEVQQRLQKEKSGGGQGKDW